MLAASDITPEHAAKRGYMSCGPAQRSYLADTVKVVKTGVRTPGLLIPLLRADGSTWGWQYRPDDPRLRDGKPIKYETPWHQRNGLDVPPGVGPMLDDPSAPLWITEGTKKADCGALHGLCIVALTGVWNWMYTSTAGSKMALEEFRDIPLNGRRVILAFDGDVARKVPVQKALHALAQYLSYKGARIEYLHLPDTDNKTGLDDYLMSGHTVEDLWRLVKPIPPTPVTDSRKSEPQPEPEEPEPPTEPIDGAELLDDIETWFRRFIRVTFDGDLAVLALWTVHTHLVEELRTTPQLQLDSVLPESGKTTVLDHFSRLCRDAVLISSSPSQALIPRMLEDKLRTLLLDEIDRTLRPDGPGTPDLLAVVNSGYRSGATRPVLVPVQGGGWETAEMSTYAPVAMAGNYPNLPDDTVSRCIRILLMPDLDGTVEDSDWEEIEDDAHELRRRIERFANQVREQVKGMKVPLPDGCISRTKEKWRPLKRVAVAAGGRWPDIADGLIRSSVAELHAEREAGLRNLPPGLVLLTDLYKVWPDDLYSADGLVPTKDLVSMLVGHNPDYWGPDSNYGKALTEHRFGKLVSKSARVTSTRVGGGGPRGFRRGQFKQAWRRLGIDANPSGPSGQSGQTGTSGAPEPDDVPVVPVSPVRPLGPDGSGRDDNPLPADASARSNGLRTSVSHFPRAADADQNARYRNHLCIDCGNHPPSAGRPRCEKCHRAYTNVMNGYDR
jgi:hypothetical protein